MLPVPSTTPLSASQPCANLNAYAPSATTIPECRISLGGGSLESPAQENLQKGLPDPPREDLSQPGLRG